MWVVLVPLFVPVAVTVVVWLVGEWRARDDEARMAIEDAFRTAHHRVLMGRIHMLCRYPGAYPYRRPNR